MRGLRSAGGSLVAIACLGIGIGASAMALTLADATIMRPFGLRAGELVVMWESDPARPEDIVEVSLPDFDDWERRATTFLALAAFGSSHWPGIAQHGGDAFAIAPRAVSWRFFSTLGRAPMLGRDFNRDDVALANPAPVMLSHAFWVSRFGGAPDVVGQSLTIDNEPHRIVGVMPRGFAFPDAPDVWVSVERVLNNAFAEMPAPQRRAIGVLMVVGRLAPGADAVAARAELSHIVAALHQQHRPKQKPTAAVVTPFGEVVLGRLGARVWIAIAMTVAVLLFACANVAALRLSLLRSGAGALAARLCLGATPGRLMRDVARETVPLVLASGVAAVVVALGIYSWLRELPVVIASGIDFAQIWFVPLIAIVAFSALAWTLVSIPPAVAAIGAVSPADVTLGTRTVARGSRAPNLVLVAQTALALCLVTMAGGAFATFARLAATDVGFSTSNVTTVDVSVPDWKYSTPEERTRVDTTLVRRLETVPGTTSVAGVSVRPFRFGEIADGLRIRAKGDPTADGNANAGIAASRVIVTARYFETMGIDLMAGRVFSDFDASGAPTVVVSRSVARALWGDGDALGKQLEFFTLSRGWTAAEVVGVVEDLRSRVIDRPAVEVYVAHGTGGLPLGSFVMRHDATSPITAAALRSALQVVDPGVVVDRVQTTRAVVDHVLAPSRLLSTAMTILAGTGLVLLGLGMFGAAATILGSSRREVAIRQAVGATPLRAARAPLGSLFVTLVVGLVAGALLAPAGMGLLASMGVAEKSALSATMGLAAATVIAAAVVAIGLNVRRAAGVSPAELLRAE